MKPIVVHPRMDFMLYAMDAIVNQAAKWRHMVGGQDGPGVTIRSIINRGGEQGAQHSQALHAWFAHIPGLRVVMPSSVQDARDLLVASVLSPDPVVYIDDRWLYEQVEELPPLEEKDLKEEGPKVVREGKDLTVVGCGYTTRLALDVAIQLGEYCDIEVIDIRVLNPFKVATITTSVEKTRRLLVIDGGWSTCGMSAEVLAAVYESMGGALLCSPARITLPSAPAPTPTVLEQKYYPSETTIKSKILEMLGR